MNYGGAPRGGRLSNRLIAGISPSRLFTDRLYTQGFHQPLLQAVELDNQAALAGGAFAFTFTVAPNPVASYLTVGITASDDASFQLRLTDIKVTTYAILTFNFCQTSIFMKKTFRLCLALLTLLPGSFSLMAQSGHKSSTVQPGHLDPTAPATERHPSSSGFDPNRRPVQPPVGSEGRSDAGARISAAMLETFNYSKSIVLWTVPANVYQITIEARGAEGGKVCDIQPGKGASITGTVAVTPGTQLKILVGQQGIDNGGGGGTFVTTSANSPLVIAGGGGGCGEVDSPNKEGQAGTSGGNGSSGGPYPGASEGFSGGFSGGQNGNGGGRGVTCNQTCWGSGGGLLTDGGNELGGIAFVNGGIRVPGNSQSNFGGGGVGSYRATGGGGGGYSGGGSGGTGYYGGVGGGGGSYNAGANQTNTGGVNTGNGLIKFSYTPCQPADASFTGLAGSYCADAADVTLVPATSGGTFSGPGVSGTTFTPANAGSGGSITYKVNQNTCPSSSSQSVTVKALPVPAITGLSNSYCKDASEFTLAGSPAGGGFTIDGNSASQLAPTYLSAGNHTVRYTVTQNGCSAFIEQRVEIKALPNAAISGLETAYCKDAALVTLTGSPADGSFTIDGSSASQLVPANLSAGSHTVRYTVTQNGCSAFAEQRVEIKALPVPAITGLSNAYCKDASAVTLAGSPAGGGFTIDGSSASQLVPTDLSAGNHTVRYTVTENGCSAFIEQRVEIKALPNAGFTGLAGPYCADAAAVTLTPATAGGVFSGPGVAGNIFTPASAGSGGSITYLITINGCTNSTSQSVTVKPLPTPTITRLSNAYCKDASAVTLTGSPAGGGFTIDGSSASQLVPTDLSAGNHTVRYTVTENGCSAFIEQRVEIKALPNAGFTGLAGPYCADAAAVTLTPATAGGAFSGPGVAGNTFTPASAGSGGGITYVVTINGCVNSTSQSVTVNALPTTDAGVDQSVILGFGGTSSNCTYLKATANGGSGGDYTYVWNLGSLNGAMVRVCPETTTTYEVTLKDGNGCMARDQVTINVKDVRCGPGSKEVNICYYGVTQCVSEKIAARYLKLGATLGGCGSSAARIGGAESADLPLQLTLKPYPNPTTDVVIIEVLSAAAGLANFQVIDLTGQARQSRTERMEAGLNQVQFKLGDLPVGLYLIRAVDALNRQGVVKVSKE